MPKQQKQQHSRKRLGKSLPFRAWGSSSWVGACVVSRIRPFERRLLGSPRRGCDHDTAELSRMPNKRARKATLLQIPGHHDVADNEEADNFAKHAAAITDGAPRVVSLVADSAPIRRTQTDPPPCHCRNKSLRHVFMTELQTVEHRRTLPSSAPPLACKNPSLRALVAISLQEQQQ